MAAAAAVATVGGESAEGCALSGRCDLPFTVSPDHHSNSSQRLRHQKISLLQVSQEISDLSLEKDIGPVLASEARGWHRTQQ